jgi:hypothetical protein
MIQNIMGMFIVTFSEDRKLFQGYIENFMMMLRYYALSGSKIEKPL